MRAHLLRKIVGVRTRFQCVLRREQIAQNLADAECDDSGETCGNQNADDRHAFFVICFHATSFLMGSWLSCPSPDYFFGARERTDEIGFQRWLIMSRRVS